MKDEICAAVSFLTGLVNKNGDITADQAEVFRHTLNSILTERFKDHWFPERPCKGQAYRCIRVNEMERRDPVLEKAAQLCGLEYENLKLPVELTLWVDPLEVCCRFGEHDGSYCTVATFKDNKENLVENINVDDHCQRKMGSQPDANDTSKKPKNRRKSDRQKKQPSPRTFNQPMLKNLPSRTYPPNLKSTPLRPSGYTWNPVPFTIPSRVYRPGNMYQEMRRPKKQPRAPYQTDHYPWLRK